MTSGNRAVTEPAPPAVPSLNPPDFAGWVVLLQEATATARARKVPWWKFWKSPIPSIMADGCLGVLVATVEHIILPHAPVEWQQKLQRAIFRAKEVLS